MRSAVGKQVPTGFTFDLPNIGKSAEGFDCNPPGSLRLSGCPGGRAGNDIPAEQRADSCAADAERASRADN